MEDEGPVPCLSKPIIMAVACVCFVASSSGAIRLRPGDVDACDYSVNTSTAMSHSRVLSDLISDLGERDDALVLPVIAKSELERIVEFIRSNAGNDVDGAIQWARLSLNAISAEERRRLLRAADYLDMDSLMIAVALTGRTWDDIAELRDMLPSDALRLVVDKSSAVTRLRQEAGAIRESIVREIRERLLAGGGTLPINTAIWDDLGTGRNVLQWAAANGEELIVELLVKALGVDVNSHDADEMTPLHWAAVQGHYRIFEVLMDAPAVNVNARSGTGMSPLHLAAYYGRRDIVELLLGAPGVDLDAKDDMQQTALDIASDAGYADIVDLLRPRRHEGLSQGDRNDQPRRRTSAADHITRTLGAAKRSFDHLKERYWHRRPRV
ncbi:Ankyrin repeat domain-containing protein [Plasmodiophora brassicae]